MSQFQQVRKVIDVPSIQATGQTTFLCHGSAILDEVQRLGAAFDEPLLRVRDQYHAPGRLLIEPSHFPINETELSLVANPELLAESMQALGLAPSSARLQVMVDDLVLARRHIVASVSLDQIETFNSWAVTDAAPPLASPRGFDIRVIAYIESLSDSDSSKDIREGSWFVSRKFEVRSATAAFRFSPHPLTKEVRTALGVQREALSHIQISGDVLDCESLADITDVYIDEEVLELLSESPNSATSLSFQVLFAAQVLSAVLSETIVRVQTSPQITASSIEKTPVGGLLKDLAISSGRETSEVLGQLIDNPASTISLVQNLLQARKRIALAIREMV